MDGQATNKQTPRPAHGRGDTGGVHDRVRHDRGRHHTRTLSLSACVTCFVVTYVVVLTLLEAMAS